MKEKKTTIERENLQNFHKTTIGEEKIRLIPIEITGEFNNEFNEIWLKIQIGENKGKKTTIQRENLEQTSQLSKRKFPQSDLKWQEKMKNFKSESNEIPFNIQIEVKIAEKNDMWKTKFYKMWRKFHNFSPENSPNQIWNDRRKCRISKWIQRSMIEHLHWSENGRKTRKENDIWKKNLENLHKISRF